MIESMPVSCLVNRTWNTPTKDWVGQRVEGMLINISTQSDTNNQSKLIPVGIILLNDGTFESVPMEFIKKL